MKDCAKCGEPTIEKELYIGLCRSCKYEYDLDQMAIWGYE